jgi:hypothetical protein
MKILKSKRFLKYIQKTYGINSFEEITSETVLKDYHDIYRLNVLNHKYYQVWPETFPAPSATPSSFFKAVATTTSRRQINKDA